MKFIHAHLLTIILLMIVCSPAQASGTPPINVTPIPVTQPTAAPTGFPWGLVVVFVAAGFIMTYVKKGNPNQITTTTCLPLIDEKKIEAEKKRIAEEEVEQKKL